METADLLEAYEWMVLTRTFDDAMVALWKQGRGVGGTFSERGHEAISVGVGMAMGADDVAAPMHRDLGTYLVRGMDPATIFGNLLGKTTGPTRGRDANLHGLGDLSLGLIGFISHIPQALPTTLGAAMAFRYRDEARVAVTFVGDGGTSSGGFHETVNMAALYNAPFVLIVENNQYAYSTPLDQQMKQQDIAGRMEGYGVPGVKIDGNDVESVNAAAVEAFERARTGGGPTVIEAVTMRMLGHAIHDGAEYVPSELLAYWADRDPVDRTRQRLADLGTDEPLLAGIEQRASATINEAIATAMAAPLPDPTSVGDGVYA